MSKTTQAKLSGSSALLNAIVQATLEAAKAGMTTEEIAQLLDQVKAMVESDDE